MRRLAVTVVTSVLVLACSSEESPSGSSSTTGGQGGAGTGGAGPAAGRAETGGSPGGASSPTGGRPAAGAAGASGGGTVNGGASVGGNAAGAPVQAGTAGASAAGAASGGTGGAIESALGAKAIEDLKAYIAVDRAKRAPLAEQEFFAVPLDEAQAKTAEGLLWDDHVRFIEADRAAETEAKSITIDGKTLRYDFKTFGTKPADGRSLYLSLHGGGEAAASVNDEQWENQKGLYEPDEGVYLAPRAPTNTWNLWHEAHIDGLFWRLIENLIVFEDVNPNKVYVMGYSAGGDGVYQLAPRMADSWAAAAMMAGHPNDAKPDSLRNIGFTIHVGGLDSAFDRNVIAGEWGMLLDALEAADVGAYQHEVQVHAGKPHWMDLEDAVAVPWMAKFTRDPIPDRVVWLQDDEPHQRFYWLAVPEAQAIKATKVIATYAAQTVTLDVQGIQTLKVRLSDAMLDLDQPVTITAGGASVFSGVAARTIRTLAETLSERGDPASVFAAEVEIDVP